MYSSVCRGLPGYDDSQPYGPEKKETTRLEQCSVTYFHTSMAYSAHHVLQQCIVWFKQLRSACVCVCLACARWGREREGRTSTEQLVTSQGSRSPCAHASRGHGSRLKADAGGGMEERESAPEQNCTLRREQRASGRPTFRHCLSCLYNHRRLQFIAFEILNI